MFRKVRLQHTVVTAQLFESFGETRFQHNAPLLCTISVLHGHYIRSVPICQRTKRVCFLFRERDGTNRPASDPLRGFSANAVRSVPLRYITALFVCVCAYVHMTDNVSERLYTGKMNICGKMAAERL